MMIRKQFILFYTCKKGLSALLLLVSFVLQANNHLNNSLAYQHDSTLVRSQGKIFTTESILIYGLENVSIEKIPSQPKVKKSKKTVNSSKPRKSLKRSNIVKGNKTLSQKPLASLCSSDRHVHFGNWKLPSQIVIISNNYCFKKINAIKSCNIYFIKEHISRIINITSKYILLLIISLFLILYRLRPPPAFSSCAIRFFKHKLP